MSLRHPRQLLILGLCFALSGCVSSQQSKLSQPLPSSAIDELHLLAFPIAVDLDKRLGADAFQIKVYAVSRQHPKTLPIPSGRLDILMYDGALTRDATQTNQPLRVWTYAHTELPAFQFKSTIGTGYAFTPQWGSSKPTQDKITVTARYTPATEAPFILSAPNIITVVSQ